MKYGRREDSSDRQPLIILTRAAAASIILAAVAGCTARTAYDSLRVQQEMECRRLPGADQQECLRRSGMSHDEYQRTLNEQGKGK